jgi:LacI family transcriptional regulator
MRATTHAKPAMPINGAFKRRNLPIDKRYPAALILRIYIDILAAMPDRVGRSTTLHDVARLAGVHVSTVSRVLTGSTQLNITEATRERIVEAARELNYQPNVVARALRGSSAGAVGMLVPSLRNPVYAEIIRGASERAWERNFALMIAEDQTGGDAERAYERLVRSGRIDGLLVAGVRPDSMITEAEATTNVPFVYVNRRHPGGHNVSMREEDAARLATTHLLELGHRVIAHIAGPQQIDTARRRLAGFLDIATTARIEPYVVSAAFDERAGYAAMTELLASGPPVTGVFTSNLNQAIGALAAARDAGLTVPADVSIITYDDDPISDFLYPPLTGVRMPLHDLGTLSVDSLLDRVAGGASVDVTVPDLPVLVTRASTAPVRLSPGPAPI